MTDFSDRGSRFRNSGPLTGPVTQIGAVGGSVIQNFHAPGAVVQVPQEVPSAVPFFTDRADVMASLDYLCDEGERVGSRVAVLTGPRGVGKSAVMRRWAQSRADRYPDGQIYVNLGGTSSSAVSAIDVVAAVLPRLGVWPDDIGGVLDGRIERFRSAVAGKRILLVLDHAMSAAQVIPFMTSSADVVVTAAADVNALRMHGARFREVKLLDEPFASALFCSVAGLDDPDEATASVVAQISQNFCGHLPLAIVLCGAMFAGLRGRKSLAEWFDDLRRDDRPWMRLCIEGEQPLHKIFDEVYDGLSQIEACVYRGIGVLPTDRFAAVHMAAMLSISEDAADDVLSGLVDKCVLTKTSNHEKAEGSSQFEVQGLIRRHARDVAEASDCDDIHEMRCRLVDFITSCAQTMDKATVEIRLRVAVVDGLPKVVALQDADAAHRWFDSEHSATLGYMQLAIDCGRWRHVCSMSEAWWSLAYARGQFDFALELSDRGIDVATRLGDPAISARLLGQSALVCIAIGELKRASERLDRARKLLAEVDDMDPVKLKLAASLLEWFGKFYDEDGNLDEAEAAFRQSRDYFHGLGDVRGEAIQNYHLAKLADKNKEYVAAASLAAEALRQLDRVGDSLTVGRFSIFWAHCLIKAGQPLAARAALAELCTSAAYSKADFLIGRMQECIATAAEALEDYGGARDALSAAHAAFVKAGSDKARGVASRLVAMNDA